MLQLRKVLRRHLFEPYKRELALIVLFQSIAAICALALPTMNADIINKGILHIVDGVIHPDQGYIRAEGVRMLVITLFQGAFQATAVYYGARVAMGFGKHIRGSLFHQVTEFSAREVGEFGAPSLITRITNDVQQVQMLVIMTCTMAVGAPITIAVGVVMALREDLGLSVILAVAIPVAAVILGTIVGQMMPAFQVMQERIDQINRVLREQITGIRVVRAFVREPQERVRFSEANEDLTVVALRAGRLMSGMFPVVNLIINLASAAVVWIGANRISEGDIGVGAMVAYLSYVVQILWSVVMATFMVSMIPRAAVASERIQEVLDTEPSVRRPERPIREMSAQGTLELRAVGFHYPGAEHAVLSDVTFTVPPGTTTAIVGSTGAGKTTLVNLVPRLFDATSGEVLVGGVDVRVLDPDLLWASIGLVPQRPYLFSGTVASNLRYGKPDATEDEMWEALRIAQAAEFVRNMPGGLEGRIEQGGTNVSGGQRQRLSIARALVRKPDIYVFDDSFSALDLTTDAKLRAALKPYTSEAAVVIGHGTHDELMQTNPTYAEIVQSQIGEKSAA
jgi:ATP-binding cassette subfamily B protein